MAYAEMSPPEVPVPRSSGVVVPMTDGRGNPYPEYLRTQQVGLGVVRAVVGRIDEALAGGAIRLDTVHLGESGKAHFKQHLLRFLIPELYGDPIPERVKPARRIVSRKAISLLNKRLAEAFDPPGGVLKLPGVSLTRKDLFPLLTLVHEQLFGDEEVSDYSPEAVAPPAVVVTPPVEPAAPAPPVLLPALIPPPDSDLMAALP